MAKITNIETKTFTNKADGKTSTSHIVTVDTGQTGYLSDKDSDKDLKVGESVTVSVEVKKNKKGEDYNLLTLKRGNSSSPAQTPSSPPPSSGCGCSTAPDLQEMKYTARMRIIEIALKDGLLAGKLNEEDAKTTVQTWVSMADGLINELGGKG
jgi:hypothetical protein